MEDGSPEFKYVIGSSKPIESPENCFCCITLNNQRTKNNAGHAGECGSATAAATADE